MYVADMQTYEVLYVNRHMQELYGDIVGRRCWEVIQEGMAGPCSFCTNAELVGAGGSPGQPVVWEHHNTRTRHWYHCVDQAIRWPDGRLVRMEIAYDITDRKQAEEQARVQQEQLMQADKMVTLGTLVSGIGHEINNPNNFIMLNVPLLKGAWESAAPVLEAYHREHPDFRLRGIPYADAERMLPQLLDDILHGAQRIKHIVGELKDYARAQEMDLGQEADFARVVESAVSLLSAFIRKRTRKFSVECQDGMPPVRGSAQRIEQVIINLVQNACEALESDEGGVAIRVRCDAARAGVVCTVQDEGIGISPEHLPHLTDPFFTTKRDAGGTGLGLSIAARIAQDHEGTLNFESSPGKGTTATLFLPAAG